jgi:hypothetical protein
VKVERAKREKDEIMVPQVAQGRYFPGDPHLLIDARLRSAPALPRLCSYYSSLLLDRKFSLFCFILFILMTNIGF